MKRKAPKCVDYNPAHEAYGYRNLRWVENVSDGLRLVGFADEIARKERSRAIEHRGWFTHDDGDPPDVLRGIVYQLPARNGQPQYVYGYDDPNNDDCALLCFDPVPTVMEAARDADRLAEIYAEHERDFHRAWDAGCRYSSLGESIKELRQEALQLGAEMREARRTGINAPTICNTLRERIGQIYRSIQKARKEREKLHDTYGSDDGFKDAMNE